MHALRALAVSVAVGLTAFLVPTLSGPPPAAPARAQSATPDPGSRTAACGPDDRPTATPEPISRATACGSDGRPPLLPPAPLSAPSDRGATSDRGTRSGDGAGTTDEATDEATDGVPTPSPAALAGPAGSTDRALHPILVSVAATSVGVVLVALLAWMVRGRRQAPPHRVFALPAALELEERTRRYRGSRRRR